MKSDPFSTVIVDEAARANPLDLNIPLTSAKRRVILVGDHQQLPPYVPHDILIDFKTENPLHYLFFSFNSFTEMDFISFLKFKIPCFMRP
jgi:superfamily I DNA and/or RNA helicase